ncbi:DUF5324 family protein [Kitasatospora sp. CMC57]|uniref:DUF5324 family protein n=1 Tax=Kitasatospora sp. CMC57 TaxID=3231513 RepID=UPI0038B43131
MTRLDSARDTADRTKDTLAPYAATAKETAQHYVAVMDEARHRLAPKVQAAGTQAMTGAGQAAHAARVQYAKHVAPQLEHAFGSLPPQTQKSTLKAVHRAQEAALAAKLSATRAADQARVTVLPRVTDAVEQARASITPVAQEAQLRSAAAFTALHGHVSAAEISELAAKNAKKERRHGWSTGLAVTGALAIASGLVAWQWWRSRSNPEWLVEPPTEPAPVPAADAQLNGSGRVGTGATATSTPSVSPDAATGSATGPVTASDAAEDDSDHGDQPKPHDPRKPH